MTFDIERYIPINTKEKVDQLIKEVRIDNNLEINRTAILSHINKLKIQIYFNECLDQEKREKRLESLTKVYQENKSKKKNKKEEKIRSRSNKRKEEEDASSHQMLSYLRNLSISDIAKFILMDSKTVLYIFKSKLNVDFELSDIPSEDDIYSCREFLSSRFKSIIRKNKRQQMLEDDINSYSNNRKRYLEKSQMSYGKEGNYSKLIYIRTKT